ncbi:regulatory protein RecX [Erwinia endophytica]|uniref:regulatory protein RecX n=1 Tax=Erwinia endophytica TaxID=1563158 RepID=UPI001265DFF7|nr:regulatory protein RecX [Erwinia endophytica]KAB8308257.1 regulatory protein RecX [Erwinia endophytica]
MSDATAHNQFSRLLDRAMRILALRDHSEAEFRHKLSLSVARSAMYAKEQAQVPPTPEQIDRVVVWCYENHYLDDAHFAERFVASRSRKGYGPQRIRMELEQKGVDRTLTDDALASAEIDWSRQAREVAERKFGRPLPANWQEKAKVQRYLMTKGFFSADIRSIFSNFDD